MRQLQSLTPLRGIAALAVVMFHLTRGSDDTSVPASFLRGYLGVDLFFVLSGFVLAHVYGRGFLADRSWRAIGAFLWARFARVYPLHLFVMAVLVAAGYAQGLSALTVLANFLLLLVPWPVHNINPPSWSLSAEWYAYLLFPFMVGWLWRCDKRIAAAVCVALLLGLDILIVGSLGDLHEVGYRWPALARALPEFVVGVLTYRAFSDRDISRRWQGDAAFIAIAASLVLAVAVVSNDGVIVALLPLLLLAEVSDAGLAGRLLNAKPLRSLGDISYSVSLGQSLAFAMVPALSLTRLGTLLGLNGLRVFAVVATLAIGTLVYRCIELPCRTLLRRAPGELRRLAARA